MKNRIITKLQTVCMTTYSLVALSALRAEQSGLSAGDIVFLGANTGSVTPDSNRSATGNFSFAPLVNIAAGTAIHFTDQARNDNSSGGFSGWRRNLVGRFNEVPIYTWVAPSAISAGTRVIIQDTVLDGMTFTSTGDTLIAFQGSVYNPSFISAIGFGQTANQFISSGSVTNVTNSYLPGSLSLGVNAVSITSSNIHADYNEAGTTVGTAADLRTLTNTSTNWTHNEVSNQFGPPSLTVTNTTNAPKASIEVSGFNFNTASGLTPTVQMSNTTLSNFAFSGLGTNTSATGATSLSGKAFHVTGGWDINSIDTNSQYFGFTIDVVNGSTLTLENIGASFQSTSNISIDKYYSTDNFLTSTKIGDEVVIVNTNVNSIFENNLNITGLTGSVAFRFYGFNAADAGADLSIDEVWFQGSISIPEPSVAILTTMGALVLLRRRRTS